MIPQRNSGTERSLWITTVFCLLYAIFALVAGAIDHRVLGWENLWLKPLKFGISTGVYLATLLWAVRMLSPRLRAGRAAFLSSMAACLCTVFELVYIGIQAGRGQASHFNLTTPLYSAMYTMMAVAAVALVLSGMAIGIILFLDQDAALSKQMRWGAGLSFVVSTVLTIVTAITMGGRLSHHVGVELAAAVRVPGLGWSLTVGDMRVPHFLSTHLMQAGPLVSWMSSRVFGAKTATLSFIGFALVWTVVTLWIFRVVLGGGPFFRVFA